MLNLFMYIFCSNLLVTLIETFSVSAFCSSKGYMKPYVEMNFNAVPRLSEKECNDHLVILWLWKYSGSIFAKYLLSLMYLIEDNTFGSSPVLCVWLHIYIPFWYHNAFQVQYTQRYVCLLSQVKTLEHLFSRYKILYLQINP